MKIGILTYQRAENYGAVLQAFALKTFVEGLGHKVSFIDYWPKYHSDYFRIFPLQQLKKRGVKGKIVFFLKLILWSFPRLIRKKRFQAFISEYLGVQKQPKYTSGNNITEAFDLVIYGSDQIWRKQRLDGVDFDSWYFGSDNVVAARKVVYAGSMGTIETSIEDNEYVKNMMRNFSSISVREKDLQAYLSGLGVVSILVSDPVFLLPKEKWLSLKQNSNKRKKKYILFYNLLNTKESTLFAEELSRNRKLPIIEINKQMSFKHIGNRYVFSASVGQFLQLIDEAEFVVSNSFHGVAMSVILEKQFFAVGMGAKANRVKSLLSSLGISNRYVDMDNIPIDNCIDYRLLNHSLQQLRNVSAQYLEQAVNNCTS